MAEKETKKRDYIERPAGNNDGTYIIDCSFLAMLVASKGRKVGASLKTTGVEPGKAYEVTSSELTEGVTIPANNGGQQVENDDMIHE